LSSSSQARERLEKRAQRHLIKGHFDKALQEYRNLLEQEPKDRRILHRMAELMERQGDRQGAIQTWMKVAKSYSRGEFPQQAVSVYKHILDLDRKNLVARLRLAEEYARLGFTLDAVEQYMESATQLELAGKTAEVCSVYRHLVQLQPSNVDYRLRLAQLLAATNQTPEAAEMMAQTALELARARRIQEFIFWGERALSLEALNVELLNGLARIYMGQGNYEQAMAKLEPSLRADPYNVDTLWLLANLFHRNGQPGKVRLLHQRLCEMCEQQGNPSKLKVTVEKVARMLPAERPAARPVPARPARNRVVDLRAEEEIPEIGSAEFFMLDEKTGPQIRISNDFLASIPEISPEDCIMIP